LELVLGTEKVGGSLSSQPGFQANVPCMLDWTDNLTRAEEDLSKEVVVSVISDRPDVAGDEITSLIVPHLNVAASVLVLRHFTPSSYLLFVPRLEMVTTLVECQPLLCAASFSIACNRWSRFAGSIGGLLPSLVEIEIRVIPFHAWEIVTAAQLLNPFAWIRHVHSDTLELVDLSIFWCTSWAWDPTSIPMSKDLWIVELPSVPDEAPPGKKTLIYPIRIGVRVCARQTETSSDLDGIDGFDRDGDHSRWRRVDHDGSHSNPSLQ
jgi:hypothetical protein